VTHPSLKDHRSPWDATILLSLNSRASALLVEISANQQG